MSDRPKLGKGLEALIPKSYFAQGKTITQIPIHEIEMNPYQPRYRFDDDKILGLSESIKQYGLNSPILVRKVGVKYQLIAGERRYRACILAKLQTIPAIIKNVSDKQSLEIALIENLEREDLNPIEEAKGYQRLIQEFNFTHSDLAKLSKTKSRSAITNTLRLLNLPQVVVDAIEAGDISSGHGRALLSFDNEDEILKNFNDILNSGLNVRQVESKKKVKSSKAISPELNQLLANLSERLSHKVSLSGTVSKGRLSIAFKSNDEFNRLCSLLDNL